MIFKAVDCILVQTLSLHCIVSSFFYKLWSVHIFKLIFCKFIQHDFNLKIKLYEKLYLCALIIFHMFNKFCKFYDIVCVQYCIKFVLPFKTKQC